jgi:hypothetical protein
VTPPGFIPLGVGVEVLPMDSENGAQPVTLTFSQVTQAGMASLTIKTVGSGGGSPGRPTGFKYGIPPTYYEISITAIFSGPVEICFNYDETQYNNESHLDLWHLIDGTWERITTVLNTENNIICGTTLSFSPFAILEPDLPPTVTANGPFYVNEGSTVPLIAFGNDPEDDPLTYAWDLDNNGSFETPGQNVTFSAVGLEAPVNLPVSVRVTDSSGLSAIDQSLINVTYNFKGFFQPVDNLPILNTVTAGRAIPVKFGLSGNQSLNIFTSGYPSSTVVSCGTTAEDAIEETVAASTSLLSYDSSTDQYTYVWKTEKTWAGTCRTLVVKLIDGTYHKANFKFK